MPLHAHPPVRVASPFALFDPPVSGRSRDPKAAARFLNGLVMRAVDARAGRTVQLGQLRAGLELGFMQSVRGRLLIVPIVIDFSSQSLGDVLKKRTSQVDVEALDPVADGQNGLAFSEGVLQEREIGALAV